MATGRVFVSTPSTGSVFRSAVTAVEGVGVDPAAVGCGVEDCATAFRSRGVYSVVREGAGCVGARQTLSQRFIQIDVAGRTFYRRGSSGRTTPPCSWKVSSRPRPIEPFKHTGSPKSE